MTSGTPLPPASFHPSASCRPSSTTPRSRLPSALFVPWLTLWIAASGLSPGLLAQAGREGLPQRVTRYLDGVGGFEEIRGARDLVMSPDGRHLYVCSDIDGAVALIVRDPASGLLTPGTAVFRDLADGTQGFRLLALAPDGTTLYAMRDTSDNALTVWRRDVATGELTPLETKRDFGSAKAETPPLPSDVIVSPDGRHVYVTPHAGRIVIFDRRSDGRLDLLDAFEMPDRAGAKGQLDFFEALAFSSDGRHLYAIALVQQTVTVLRRNPSDGRLEQIQQLPSHRADPGLSGGPTALVMSPDGRQLYITGEGFVSILDRDPEVGSLQLRRTLVDGKDGVAGLDAAFGIGLDAAGTRLYVPVFREPGRIVIFDRDPATGELGFAGSAPATGASSSGVLSPDGRHLYIAHYIDGLEVFETHRGSCGGEGSRLCLGRSRFRVEARFQTTSQTEPRPAPSRNLTDDTGAFWFFDPGNLELMVKVLRGCTINGRVWVFLAGTTDVGVEVTVTDTQTGNERRYSSPAKIPFAPILDTRAFAACR